jgi:hypothetical protein
MIVAGWVSLFFIVLIIIISKYDTLLYVYMIRGLGRTFYSVLFSTRYVCRIQLATTRQTWHMTQDEPLLTLPPSSFVPPLHATSAMDPNCGAAATRGTNEGARRLGSLALHMMP